MQVYDCGQACIELDDDDPMRVRIYTDHKNVVRDASSSG